MSKIAPNCGKIRSNCGFLLPDDPDYIYIYIYTLKILEIHTTKIFWSFVSVLFCLVGSSKTTRFTKERI